jgi:hypothetical protein
VGVISDRRTDCKRFHDEGDNNRLGVDTHYTHYLKRSWGDQVVASPGDEMSSQKKGRIQEKMVVAEEQNERVVVSRRSWKARSLVYLLKSLSTSQRYVRPLCR